MNFFIVFTALFSAMVLFSFLYTLSNMRCRRLVERGLLQEVQIERLRAAVSLAVQDCERKPDFDGRIRLVNKLGLRDALDADEDG